MTMQNSTGQKKEKITALYCRLSVDDDKKDIRVSSPCFLCGRRDFRNHVSKAGFSAHAEDGGKRRGWDNHCKGRFPFRTGAGRDGQIDAGGLSFPGYYLYRHTGKHQFHDRRRNGNAALLQHFQRVVCGADFQENPCGQRAESLAGQTVSSIVAYGYKKIEGDKEQWYIDEPAAQTVRKIYALCLAGKGPSKIARQLEKEKVLTPTAYFHSIGRKTSNPMPANIYGWRENTIEHILGNRQYTGCSVNGKSTTVSYKVHKVIENPKEEYQIIPHTQEAIIDENVWLRVQELRKNKRRPTKTNRKSLFSVLLFCADCKSKLHFCAAKSLKRNQEFFRCANYKDGRGTCSIHFIRDIVLGAIVKETVADLADFVRRYESVFLFMQKQKCGDFQKKRQQELKFSIESSRKRIADLDRLFSRIYEDNVIGKLSDERYTRMAAEYEAEQKELLEKVKEEEKQLSEMEQKSVDMRLLLQGLREFTDMKELTPTIVNKLIQRIEVHSPEKKHARKSVKIDIYFTAVGLVSLPSEQESLQMAEQIRTLPQAPCQIPA